MGKRKEEFKKGFKKVSLSILVLSFAIALVLAYFAADISETIFESGFILNFPLENLLSDTDDYKTYTTYKLYEFREQESDTYNLYLLGGSSARECITSYKNLEEKINSTYGTDINVEFLTLDTMSLLDMIQIVENLPEDSGAVSLSLSNRNTLLKDNFNQLYISSDIYTDYYMHDKYVIKMRGQTEFTEPIYSFLWMNKVFNNFMDNPRFIFEKKEINFHYFATDKDKLDFATYIIYEQEKQYNITQEDVEFFEEILNVVIDLAESKGLDVILFETPYNTECMGDMLYEAGTRYTYFTEIMAEVTQTREVYYFDYVKELDIEIDEFYDVVHIKSERAQELVENGFVESFKEVIDGIKGE